jgi:hypothetical protein
MSNCSGLFRIRSQSIEPATGASMKPLPKKQNICLDNKQVVEKIHVYTHLTKCIYCNTILWGIYSFNIFSVLLQIKMFWVLLTDDKCVALILETKNCTIACKCAIDLAHVRRWCGF